MILLNPGPVTLSPRVRNALLRDDLCHREQAFADLTLDLRRKLEQVYPAAIDAYRAVLLTGSGTAAVEAMLTSLVPPSAKTLVVSNGVYGERMAEILRRHRRPHVLLDFPWQEPISVQRIEDALASAQDITHIACVHHETTTGRLNGVHALGKLCRDRNIPLLLDAVSSFGAEELRFSEWNLLAAAATANKCLHGVPGVSFVLARSDALSMSEGHAGSLYLDLHLIFNQQRHGWSPFTQSVQGFFALQEALREFDERGGQPARKRRYMELSARLRQALPALGADLLLAEGEYASMLTSFRLPAHVRYEALHDGLMRAGFTIYAGQGPFASTIFRIACMGEISDAHVDQLLDACRRLFENAGETA